MLVGANDRSIDHHPLPIGFLDRFEDGGPSTFFRPAAEPLEDGIPRSESFGQVAPGCSGSQDPEDRSKEYPIVGGASGIGGFTRQHLFDSGKLLVGQFETSHRKALHGLAL